MSAVVSLAHGAIFASDYRVVRPLSEGGMGAVYVVEQLSTGKQRALKVMHPNLVNDQRQRQRFIQEAKIGANIESDHVVEVLGAGIEQNMPWLAMELLQGETLDDRIEKKGPVPPAEVAEIFSQLCHAIAAAHDVGIVHRDLKPENVFLSNPRRVGVPFTVKVLDFGIAKLVAESGSTTQAIGSPLWMAPEQTNAEASITPATDVWALGLLAFASLTGKYFWKSAHVEVPNPMTIVMEVCFEPLPKASERAEELGVGHLIPDGFDEWFAQCVSREIAPRFQKVRALQGALNRVLLGTESAPAAKQAPSLLTPAPRATPFSTSASFEAELDLPKPKPKPEPAKKEEPPKKPEKIEVAPAPAAQVVSPAEMVERVSSVPKSRPVAVKPSVGMTRHVVRSREVERSFPWVKTLLVGAVLLGGLFVAQRFFWTRAPAPEPQSSQSAAPPSASQSAPPPPKPSNANAGKPCGAGMARVPAGELVIGDPAKAVDTFCMDVSEVTVKAYAACVKSGKCTAPAPKGDWIAATHEEKKARNESCNGLRADRNDHPATCVDALQADAYCKAQGKRLPSDLEWEWAARSGAARFKYPWGPESPDVQLCWSAFKARTGTCPVGSYPKGDDAYGIHDLAGNVREWTSTSVGPDRLHCGSDWTDKLPDELFKLGYCGQAPQKSKSAFLGFRCAL
ncbi:MAG: protein kinase domain-containing protein [Polyangiales bacterium]